MICLRRIRAAPRHAIPNWAGIFSAFSLTEQFCIRLQPVVRKRNYSIYAHFYLNSQAN